MAKKLYIEGNYIIADLDDGSMPKTFATGNSEYNEIGSIFYLAEVEGTERIAIPFNDAGLWEDAASGGVVYTEATLRTFLRANSGFNSAAGGSVADGVSDGDIPVWNATTEEYEPGTDQHIGSANLTISDLTREIIMNSSVSTVSFMDSTGTNALLTLNGAGQVWSHGVGNVASSTSYGYLSMGSNSGGYNTGLGGSTLASNTTGAFNTAIGSGALSANLTGQYNTAVGRGALASSTGTNNTGLGGYALRDNTSGNGNVGVGYLALENNLVGDQNVVIGDRAIQFQVGTTTALTNIDDSVVLGALTKATQNSTNEVIIGKEAEGNGSNTATIGNSSIADLYIGTTIHLYQEAALAADSGLSVDGTIATNDTITNAIRSRLNDLESRLQSMGLIQ